ncbi:MAG: M67 family metallopeptidase [Candidatus Thorarchaeota archaeon]
MDCHLILRQMHLEELHSHAEGCLPEESVALLFGTVEGSNAIVKSVAIVSNEAKSRTTFSVEPTLQYRLLVDAEARGEELVCIFHSHPAPPEPSQTDLKNMKLNPVFWIIASKESGSWESKAFLLENEKAMNVPIIFSDEEL